MSRTRLNAARKPTQPTRSSHHNASRHDAGRDDPGGDRSRHVPLLTAAVVAGTAVLVLATPQTALADPGGVVYLAANDLPTVINNLKTWVMGILAAIATLFLVLAGVYWATAGGDPAQVDKAKSAFRNALIGYGMAVLAPIFLQILQGIVGTA